MGPSIYPSDLNHSINHPPIQASASSRYSMAIVVQICRPMAKEETDLAHIAWACIVGLMIPRSLRYFKAGTLFQLHHYQGFFVLVQFYHKKFLTGFKNSFQFT